MMNIKDVLKEYSDANSPIDVGEGWRELVRKLAEDIVVLDKKVEVSQIKEKFGGLRFYIYGAKEEVHERILKAERESLKTCELCGTKKSVTTKPNKGSYWVLTLCNKCRKSDSR